jgi:hypothetical protein
MPTPVDWYDDEQTIIKVTITRSSTWNEYHKVIDWIVTEVEKVDHRVDIIFHDEVGMPKGNPLPHLRVGSKKIIDLPNSGHTFIAGSQGMSSTFMQMLMEAIAKVFIQTSFLPSNNDKQLKFVPTFEAALKQIEAARKKLHVGM